jgi:hypothetical protein
MDTDYKIDETETIKEGQYTVYWIAEAHGSCTITANSVEDALDKVEETGYGMEIININELIDFQVKDADWFSA